MEEDWKNRKLCSPQRMHLQISPTFWISNHNFATIYNKTEVPGYEGTMSRHTRPMTGLERSLYKLNAVRELGEWANEFIDMDAEEEDDGNDGNGVFITQEKAQSTEATTSEAITSTPNAETKGDKALLKDDEQDEGVPTFFAQPCVTPVPNSAVGKTRQDSVIVIIRHGKTQV